MRIDNQVVPVVPALRTPPRPNEPTDEELIKQGYTIKRDTYKFAGKTVTHVQIFPPKRDFWAQAAHNLDPKTWIAAFTRDPVHTGLTLAAAGLFVGGALLGAAGVPLLLAGGVLAVGGIIAQRMAIAKKGWSP